MLSPSLSLLSSQSLALKATEFLMEKSPSPSSFSWFPAPLFLSDYERLIFQSSDLHCKRTTDDRCFHDDGGHQSGWRTELGCTSFSGSCMREGMTRAERMATNGQSVLPVSLHIPSVVAVFSIPDEKLSSSERGRVCVRHQTVPVTRTQQ